MYLNPPTMNWEWVVKTAWVDNYNIQYYNRSAYPPLTLSIKITMGSRSGSGRLYSYAQDET